MSLNLILGFVPWFLYLIISGNNLLQFKIAILAGLIASIVCQIPMLKKGFILSWGTTLFFLFMTVGVVLLNNSWIIQNADIISNGSLTLIVLISILVGKPFTLQYARELVPAEKWNNRVFIQINYLLSFIWLGMFLLGLCISLFRQYNPGYTHWLFDIFSYVPIILGSWISSWFPDWYKSRHMD